MSNLNKNKGFTLVEILLVVAIMGLLSVAAMISVTATINRMKFQNVFNKVEQMIFDARSMAINGKQVPDCTDVNQDSKKDDKVVAAGYGLHLTDDNPSKFILFSDMHSLATGTYVDPPGQGIGVCRDIADEIYEVPEGFMITVTPSVHNFIYLPPNAVFVTDSVELGPYSIEIKNEDYGFKQVLKIEEAGAPKRMVLESLQ